MVRRPCLIDHDGLAQHRAEAVFVGPDIDITNTLFEAVQTPLANGDVIESVRPRWAGNWHVHEVAEEGG